MSRLAELQESFGTAVLGGVLPRGLKAREPREVERRFNVYRNNVVVSLTEALAARFPVIARLVGADFFSHMARLYLEQEAPRTPLLWQWGSGFPSFVQAFAPLHSYPYMADVARIEFQRGVAFHAADRSAAQPDLFVDADPAALVLTLHPSLAVLRLHHPAVTIWQMNQPGHLPGPVAGGAEIALVLRDTAFDVPVRAISIGDADMIDELARGEPLLKAAQAGLAADPAHDAARLLRELVAAGMITSPGD